MSTPIELNLATEPAVQLQLELTAGTPGPAVDTQPLLDAIAALAPAVREPLLAAIAGISAIDLAPVLAAIAAIPTTDVAAALAAYGGATSAELAEGIQALSEAIESIPTVDLGPVLGAIAAIPTTDVGAALEGYGVATAHELQQGVLALTQTIESIPPVDLEPVLDAIAAIPPTDVSAALASHGVATGAAVTAARDSVNAHIDAKVAELASLGALPGEWRTFSRDRVPAGWSTVNGTDFTAVGGDVKTFSSAAVASSASAALVTEGSGAGVWRLYLTALQRYSLDTNAAVGSALVVPYVGAVSSGCGAIVAVGKMLYFTGGGNTTANALHFKCDTETGVISSCANFPKNIAGNSANSQGRAFVLPDGRIAYVFGFVNATGQNTASQSVFLYDPVTNATPVEVAITLPWVSATSLPGLNGSLTIAQLPSGNLLWVDYWGSATTRYSCTLSFSPGSNTVGVGASENTGATAAGQWGVLPTASGAICAAGGAWRSYAEGSGWAAASNPVAFGTVSNTQFLANSRIPGIGVFGYASASGSFACAVWTTGSLASVGSSGVLAIKN